jgi:hypothetical protein
MPFPHIEAQHLPQPLWRIRPALYERRVYAEVVVKRFGWFSLPHADLREGLWNLWNLLLQRRFS